MDIELYRPVASVLPGEIPSSHLNVQSNFGSQFCVVDEIYDQFHQRGCMPIDSEMIFSAECMTLIDWMSSKVIDSVVHIYAKFCTLRNGDKVCKEVEMEIPLCLEIDS